jgi:hypothetical protein
MKYKDQFGYNASKVLIGSFATVVDRAQPDRAFNRSLMQRLLHLISDSNGARMCNKQDAVVRDPFIGVVLQTYDECDLVDIPNLAVFYVQAIAYAKDAGGTHLRTDVGDVAIAAPPSAPTRAARPTSTSTGTTPSSRARSTTGRQDMMEISFRPTCSGVQPGAVHHAERGHGRHHGSGRDQVRPAVPLGARRHPAGVGEGRLHDRFARWCRPSPTATPSSCSSAFSVLHAHWPPAIGTHSSTPPSQAGYVRGSSAMTTSR